MEVRSSEGLGLNGFAKCLAHPGIWYDDTLLGRSSMLNDHEAMTGEERLCGEADIRREFPDFVVVCLIVQGGHEQTTDALSWVVPRNEEVVDVASRLQVCIANDLTIVLGDEWIDGLHALTPEGRIDVFWGPGADLVARVVANRD